MTSYTQKQLDRLPLWAQYEIARLKSNEEYYKKHFNKTVTGTSGIAVYTIADDYAEPAGYLPGFSYVKMNGIRIKLSEKIGAHKGLIEVSCSDQLVFLTGSANQAYITHEKF
jgi:hypothetical protein